MRILRSVERTAALIVVLVLGACGNAAKPGSSSSPSISFTSTSAPAATSTSTTSAPTTSAPTTSAPATSAPATSATSSTAPPVTTAPSTTTLPQAKGPLRADGIGDVQFGTAADAALAGLTGLFGQPDGTVAPREGVECVEGSSWRDCALSRAGTSVVFWQDIGLEVAIDQQFHAWHASRPVGGSALATREGLEPGMTVGQLRSIYPSVTFPCCGEGGVLDAYVVETSAGSLWGWLQWDSYEQYVEAVQRSLNEHGATLVVDGISGPKTRAAWDAFCTSHGLGCEGTEPGLGMIDRVSAALGFPPADLPLRDVQASMFD